MADMTALEVSPTVHTEDRLNSCIQCGDCSGICPVGYLMDFPPSKIISVRRAETYQRVLSSDSVWFCIACSACTTVCPARIPITTSLMTRAKEELVMSGQVPEELKKALESTQRYGNPLGESPRKRAEWIKGIENRVPVLGNGRTETDILWYVGDYASYHPRVQNTSRALAELLNLLGVNFAILGNDEYSDGDSQRLAGEQGLFEMLVEKNGRAFKKYRFNQIITADPHAYNAFKNEYPRYGVSYPVQHYTEFLAERLDALKPFLRKPIESVITYHDACYLGRVNEIYDPPRALLTAIPGVTLVEMPHHGKNSLCCGGGGGGMWMDGFHWGKARTRLSEWRVREARKSGAQILAVACPYETPRFEDAVKTTFMVEELSVRDISELLLESIQNK